MDPRVYGLRYVNDLGQKHQERELQEGCPFVQKNNGWKRQTVRLSTARPYLSLPFLKCNETILELTTINLLPDCSESYYFLESRKSYYQKQKSTIERNTIC